MVGPRRRKSEREFQRPLHVAHYALLAFTPKVQHVALNWRIMSLKQGQRFLHDASNRFGDIVSSAIDWTNEDDFTRIIAGA